MNKEDFAIAFSERNQEEAIKEVSLKIKLMFPKYVNYFIILFTPHYNLSHILKTLNLTLQPKKILGIQAPFLIFEERVLQKGIVACCINKPGLSSREAFLEANKPGDAESFFRSSFRDLKKRNYFLMSFLSPTVNPFSYLSGMKLSLGEVFNLLGAGYMKKYAAHSYQVLNGTVNENSINIAIKGLRVHSLQLRGYVPLGIPFTITKLAANRNLIIEINGKPAINIYAHYLEEKYNDFIKSGLFSLYPLGIKRGDSIQLVNIIECLQDGSLMYMGELKEKAKGHLMFLDTTLLFNEITNKLEALQQKGEGLIFIINSLTRRKILKQLSNEEIIFIKRTLGKEAKIIGFYSDYSFVSDEEKRRIDVEAGTLLVTLWD